MAVQITSYTDPGVIIQEVVSPAALSIASVPQTLALVGPGSKQKRATNEAVRRGGIAAEPLVVSATPGAHTATLVRTSTGLQNDSTLYINGVPLNIALWSFDSSTVVRISDNGYVAGATYTIDYVATDTDRDDLANDDVRTAVRVGSFAGVTSFDENIDYQLDDRARINGPINDTYDLSVNNLLYLQIDSKAQIIITVAGATPAVSTAAEVVADINAALIASGDYGASYGSVAEVYNGDQVRLTSPTRGPTSRIEINAGATNAATAIFGAATADVLGDSIDWSIDQAAELVGVPVITTVSTAAASVLEVAFDDLVDGAIAAEWTTLAAGPYNTTAGNNIIRLNIDARGNIDITVTSGAAVTAATIASEINAALLASASYGATYGAVASTVAAGARLRLTSPTVGAGSSIEILDQGVSNAHTIIFELDDTQVPMLQRGDGSVTCRLDVGGAITIAAIIVDINARLADHSEYGSTFSTVAQNDGTDKLRLLSPTQGETSKVRVQQAQTASAHNNVLGLTTAQLPYTLEGTGTRPEVGSVYFVTYDYVRPSSDYNTPLRVFTQDQVFGQVGESATDNPLAVAGQIAFENDAPSVFLVQVEDANDDDAYSVVDYQTAINTGLDNTAITEVAVVTPLPQTLSASQLLSIQVTLLNHVANKSSITEKKFRRGWFGMLRDTDIGDVDTAATLIYTSKRTLQVAPDSPGRGRLILCAPPNVDKTLTLTDGTQPVVELDSTYLAVAVAARHTSFESVATSLLRKTIIGFDTDTFQTYLDAERHLLAPAGVLVVTNDAGRLVMLDPITTEAGGGGLVSFSEISAGAQKDNAVRAVTQAVDANLIGIVPEDLTDFIFDIKTVVAAVLVSLISSGAIGPFRDDNGQTRDINMASDIQVFQSSTDPTRFDFRFFFNLRYPAKRIFGEFSVDSPIALAA